MSLHSCLSQEISLDTDSQGLVRLNPKYINQVSTVSCIQTGGSSRYLYTKISKVCKIISINAFMRIRILCCTFRLTILQPLECLYEKLLVEQVVLNELNYIGKGRLDNLKRMGTDTTVQILNSKDAVSQ